MSLFQTSRTLDEIGRSQVIRSLVKWSKVVFKSWTSFSANSFHQLFFWHYLAIRYQKAIFTLL